MDDPTEKITRQPNRGRKRLFSAAAIGLLCAIVIAVYVKSHPLVFTQTHAHCIDQVGPLFRIYAEQHDGRFPYQTNGYGDALLLLCVDEPWIWPVLTGPGYDTEAYKKWLGKNLDVPESECGRVYVQGLSMTNAPEIVILFDKLATPGDHIPMPVRMFSALGREVCFLDGHTEFISEKKWPTFARKQTDLLVEAGLSRDNAEAIYAEKGRVP